MRRKAKDAEDKKEDYDDVYWEVTDDLPKMTKLMVDGKALYIHRANYQINDKELL